MMGTLEDLAKGTPHSSACVRQESHVSRVDMTSAMHAADPLRVALKS